MLLTGWSASISLAPDVREMGKTNKTYASMYICNNVSCIHFSIQKDASLK